MFFALVFVQIVLGKIGEKEAFSRIALATVAVLGYVSARFIWLPFSIQSGMMAAFFIWIGYEIKQHGLLSTFKWFHYVVAALLLVLGIHFEYCDITFVQATAKDLIISTGVVLSGCVLIYGIASRYRGSILQYIGKISATVLCTRLFALEAMWDYFNIIIEPLGLTGNVRAWAIVIEETLFAVLTAIIIETFKTLASNRKKVMAEHMDTAKNADPAAITVAKGIFMIAVLIGHFDIDAGLRTIIYSCHMVAFLLLAGFHYRGAEDFTTRIWRIAKMLLLLYVI